MDGQKIDNKLTYILANKKARPKVNTKPTTVHCPVSLESERFSLALISENDLFISLLKLSLENSLAEAVDLKIYSTSIEYLNAVDQDESNKGQLIILDNQSYLEKSLNEILPLKKLDWETYLVLVCSDLTSNEELEAYRLGANLVMKKPINIEKLTILINNLIPCLEGRLTC